MDGKTTRTFQGRGGVAAPNSNGCTIKHCLQLSYSVSTCTSKAKNLVNRWPVCPCIRPPNGISTFVNVEVKYIITMFCRSGCASSRSRGQSKQGFHQGTVWLRHHDNLEACGL